MTGLIKPASTPELRAKAVWLVREHRDEYDTEWAAMKAISTRIGMSAETLRKWVRQAEIDGGEKGGVTTATEPGSQARGRRVGADGGNPEGRDKFLSAGE